MSRKVRWGILGAARIAVRKAIPAMQRSERSEVVAIASRDPQKAAHAAVSLGISKFYGTYEALLEDADVEAVYVPLPNHLHVPWSILAAEHGKHVLCEKPIGLDASDARRLLEARDRYGVVMGEAFLVRVHPQWSTVVEQLRRGAIGDLRSLSGHFSYFNDDPGNIRAVVDYGGGVLLDIGCYIVNVSRLAFGREPARVAGALDRPRADGVDTEASFVLDFGVGQATATVDSRAALHQHVTMVGSHGRLELEIPFTVPPDRPTTILVHDERGTSASRVVRIEIAACDQFELQSDRFAQAIREGTPVPCPLEDSVANMRVLDAVARSARSERWEVP
jgi:predicted dehydrogenase